MAIQHWPVDEEESLLGAGRAVRLSEVARFSAAHGREALALWDIGVPEKIVLDERAPRAEYDENIGVGADHRRHVAEEIEERAFVDTTEDGICGEDARSGPAPDLVPRSEEAATSTSSSVRSRRPSSSLRPARKVDHGRAAGRRSRALPAAPERCHRRAHRGRS